VRKSCLCCRLFTDLASRSRRKDNLTWTPTLSGLSREYTSREYRGFPMGLCSFGTLWADSWRGYSSPVLEPLFRDFTHFQGESVNLKLKPWNNGSKYNIEIPPLRILRKSHRGSPQDSRRKGEGARGGWEERPGLRRRRSGRLATSLHQKRSTACWSLMGARGSREQVQPQVQPPLLPISPSHGKRFLC